MQGRLFHIERGKRWLLRLPLLLALALAFPFLTPLIGPTADLERTIHDAYRYQLAPEVEYDPDITLVIYDDQVARTTQRTSPVDRELVAEAIVAIAGVNPRAIGLDMAFILETDQSPALIEALRQVDVPVYVIYADPEADRAVYWDPSIDSFARKDQDSFWAALEGSRVRPVSPAIGVGSAQIARSWPDTLPNASPLLAHAMAGSSGEARAYRGGIRFRMLDPEILATTEADLTLTNGMFDTVPISELGGAEAFGADFFREVLESRFVLIGADTYGADQLATPVTRIGGLDRVAGVTVHAHMLRQALDRDFPPPLGWGWIASLSIATLLLATGTAFIERHIWLLIGVGAAQIAGLAVMPFAFEALGRDILELPLFGLGLAWALAYFAVASARRDQSSEERAFARGALGRFVPKSVAQQILDDPSRLELQGEERELTLMFTDLEGFTRFCHGRDPRQTAEILNAYLDAMTAIVLDHGGTLDKYVGDAIVAFWGAPIDNPDDTAKAVACALAMQAEAEAITARAEAEHGVALGRTRIGIHRGPVIVGNFGGTNRMQYTAMGDAMNIAARLESANKQIGSDILVSDAVREAAPDFPYRALGRIAMSGVATGIALFEPLDANKERFASAWNAAISSLQSDDEGPWRELIRAHRDDRVAIALEPRMEAIRKGEVHVLQTK
ncbi:MAG: adenylate/guanylate cyclase domain-containing protein [Erythrobacter sp.]